MSRIPCVTCRFLLVWISVLSIFSAIAFPQEEEIGIEQIAIENWKAVCESIVTYEAKLKIYRVRFQPESGFDVAKFEKEITKEHQNGRVEEYLKKLFVEIYPAAKEPVPGMVWGETVVVASARNRERVRWYLSDRKLALDYLFTDNAYLRKVGQLNQIQVTNGSPMERFPAKHLISLPVISDVNEYKQQWDDKSVTCRLESTKKKQAIELDMETLAVRKLENGERYYRVNLPGTENKKIEHVVPSLFYEIQKKDGALKRLKITRLLEMKINEEVAEKSLNMGIRKGEVLIDSRTGIENAKVHSPSQNMDDAYDFLNNIPAEKKPSSTTDGSELRSIGPTKENDKKLTPANSISLKGNSDAGGFFLSKDLLRLLTIVSIVMCVSFLVTRED